LLAHNLSLEHHVKQTLCFAFTLSVSLLVGCAASTETESANGADVEEELSAGAAFNCTSHWHDDGFASGFTLTVGASSARIVDLATSHPKKPYTGRLDPSYRPTAGTTYAGHVRFRFSPRLEDFAEATAMDLLVLPSMKSGDAAYLRFQGPEGGNTETYTCAR
jgi:hypothetical protein